MINQYEPWIKNEYAETVKNQILSGWIGPGKKVIEFEEKFADYIGTKYAVACSSGTVALMIAVKCLEWDFINIPSYGFPAALNVCRFLNISFKINDINENLLVNDIKENSIIVNHNGINDFKNLNINASLNIEDAACSLGLKFKNKYLGSFGKIGCFSFSVPKIITTGQGGMLVTNDFDLYIKMKEIVDQGSSTWREDGIHHKIGLNFKLSDINASLGLIQLENINELLEKRGLNFKRYIYNNINLLPNETSLNNFPNYKEVGTWMNIIRVKNAKELQTYLNKFNIQSKLYYKSIRTHIQDNKVYSNAEKAYHECLYLPSSLTLTYDQIDFISEKILNFLNFE